MKRIFSILIFFSSVVYINAQTYNFRQFSLEEGLSQSQVFDICQDVKGNIWFGTFGGGITVYNGLFSKYYSTDDGLPSYSILALHFAQNGNTWIGTDKGVSLFNGSKFIDVDINKTINAPVWHITEDTNGTIWLGGEYSVWRYLNDKIELIAEDIYYKSPVFTDSTETIWMLTNVGTIKYIRENSKPGIFDILDIEKVKVIYKDNTNNLWFGLTEGLYCYDGNNVTKFTVKEGLPGNSITSINQDKKGYLWIGTEYNGVSVYDGKKFLNISEQQGIGFNDIIKIFVDNNKDVWIATDGGGACLFNGFAFQHFSFDNIVDNNFIMSVLVDSKNNKWFGTDGYGLIKYNNGVTTLITTNDGLADNHVYGMVEDRNGNLWIATYNGLSMFDGEHFVNYTTENSDLPINFLMAVNEDNQGNIWIGTNGGGVSKIEGTKFVNYNDTTGLPSNSVWDIFQDKSGKIYFATDQGLTVFDGKNFTTYTTEDGLNDNAMGAIIEDEKGNIWLGTEGGISRFDGKSFINYDSQNGLTSDIIYLLEFDINGNLIAGHEKGIDIIELSDNDKIESIRYYGKKEGFLGIECNSNTVAIDSAGMFWIGTMDGVVLYNPFEDKINTKEPQTNITNIKLFYKEVDWSNYTDSITNWNKVPYNLKLPYTKKNLTFEFVGTNYNIPEKVRYQFMLEGFDQDWLPETANNHVTYNNIPPGEFIFKVKACNNDGYWNTEPTIFEFLIVPPFWKTTWFYVLCFITGIFSIYGFIVIRTKRLNRARRLLAKLVRERTFEITLQNTEISAQRDKIEAQKIKIEAQRDLATKQRDQIAEQKKDITDSILYASRIQKAVMPPDNYIKKTLPQHFILYKPHKIVSGDFYWIFQKEGKIIVVAADCTGHGVPGGFLSMLGISFLNEIMNKIKIIRANEILNILRDYVIKSLHQTEKEWESMYGMDMAICIIDIVNNELQYSGANNPLYLIRKTSKKCSPNQVEDRYEGMSDTGSNRTDLFRIESSSITPGISRFQNKITNEKHSPYRPKIPIRKEISKEGNFELTEILADKMPIGNYIENNQSFTNHKIQIFKGDSLYLFTDGYNDQFGGPQGKKFRYKQFRHLLMNIQNKTMEEQKEILGKTIEDWIAGPDSQGERYPQIDDIMVIGIRIW